MNVLVEKDISDCNRYTSCSTISIVNLRVCVGKRTNSHTHTRARARIYIV
jgi:hypothetical protein